MDSQNFPVSLSLKITDSEIEILYGKSRIFHLDFSIWSYRSLENKYLGFHTYFDGPVILFIAKALELRNRGKIDKNFYEIFNDARTWIIKNYVHFDDKKWHRVIFEIFNF